MEKSVLSTDVPRLMFQEVSLATKEHSIPWGGGEKGDGNSRAGRLSNRE